MNAFPGQPPRSPQSGTGARTRTGQDTTARLDLGLDEIASGCVKEVVVDTAAVCGACHGVGGGPGSAMSTPCHECGGEGRVPLRRTLALKIPAGVDDGTRILLSGEGEAGSGGGRAGDLYVEIREKAHPVFRRRGDDLHCTVVVPMTAAVLGTRFALETMDGPAEIDLPPGTHSGRSLVLSQHGIPHLRGPGRGDIVVHVEVPTPTALDAEQEQLVRRLAHLRGEDQPTIRLQPPPAHP